MLIDGSAKTSNGLSLNDILQVGTTVQPNFYCIVLRFRTHQLFFTPDITKVYRQIIVHPLDRDLQTIFWWYSTEEHIQEYQLNSLKYGTASAAYLATRCLKKLADDNTCHHPISAQVLSIEFYVDDLLIGTSTLEKAINLQQELSSLLTTVGLTLRKLVSNHPPFLEIIPTELK